MPIGQLAANSNSARLTIRGSTGSTRVGTIRSYLRAFVDCRIFLSVAFGVNWPTSVTQITDYLHSKCSQPCSVSVPQRFRQASSWFERVAGVPQRDKFSASDLVKGTVDYAAEIASEGAPLLKRTPRSLIVLMAALELYVDDETKLEVSDGPSILPAVSPQFGIGMTADFGQGS